MNCEMYKDNDAEFTPLLLTTCFIFDSGLYWGCLRANEMNGQIFYYSNYNDHSNGRYLGSN